MTPATRTQIFAILKSLPMIRFALMLGGGMTATAGVAAVLAWLMGLGGFPGEENVWLARINGAVAIGLAMTAIVAVVMVTLAFGRAGRLGVKAPGGIELDLDFDNPDAPIQPHQPSRPDPPAGDPS